MHVHLQSDFLECGEGAAGSTAHRLLSIVITVL